MKAYFLLLFGMLWSDLGSIKSGFFFNTQASRKNTGKKPYPPITMPLAMLVTALQLHFQSCWRLSTVIPYHSIQRSSNLIEIFLSLWWSSTPTFYVLWGGWFCIFYGSLICRISCHENRQFSSYFARKLHQDRGSACYSDQREVDQCSIKWRFNRFKPLSLIVIVI